MNDNFRDTRILTIKEVAELLRVHRTTVSRLARSGELKSYILGSRRLFKESDVHAFFENQLDPECVFGKENKNGNSHYPET